MPTLYQECEFGEFPTELRASVGVRSNMCSHEEHNVTEAVALAERLLDAVVRAEVRWGEVEDLAIALAALAAKAAGGEEGRAVD